MKKLYYKPGRMGLSEGVFQNIFSMVDYLKSSKTGIDIDFYVPSDKLVIQAAYSIQENAFEREVGNLKKYASVSEEKSRYIIVTYEEEEIIEKDGIKIEVIPLMKFLLMK